MYAGRSSERNCCPNSVRLVRIFKNRGICPQFRIPVVFLVLGWILGRLVPCSESRYQWPLLFCSHSIALFSMFRWPDCWLKGDGTLNRITISFIIRWIERKISADKNWLGNGRDFLPLRLPLLLLLTSFEVLFRLASYAFLSFTKR